MNFLAFLLAAIKAISLKLLSWFITKIPSLTASCLTWLGLGVPRWVYKRWLLARFQNMPFIYQDLQLEVLSDFVELDLSSLDSSTLESHDRNKYDMRAAAEKMRDYRRALFFGEGGIGKTTFFRFCTLRMIGAASGEAIINESENVIPIFIPLKGLDNTLDYPLLHAITEGNPYLGRNPDRALAKITRLASARRVAFFLDGFDEIPYAGGKRSIIREISALFTSFDQPVTATISQQRYADFYSAARGCRVYLSSRREFFLDNQFRAPKDVPRWKVTGLSDKSGLSDKRAALVGNIFRHYKKKDAKFFSSYLHVEEFMRQLMLSQ